MTEPISPRETNDRLGLSRTDVSRRNAGDAGMGLIEIVARGKSATKPGCPFERRLPRLWIHASNSLLPMLRTHQRAQVPPAAAD
jgi:hypothetical protein